MRVGGLRECTAAVQQLVSDETRRVLTHATFGVSVAEHGLVVNLAQLRRFKTFLSLSSVFLEALAGAWIVPAKRLLTIWCQLEWPDVGKDEGEAHADGYADDEWGSKSEARDELLLVNVAEVDEAA